MTGVGCGERNGYDNSYMNPLFCDITSNIYKTATIVGMIR